MSEARSASLPADARARFKAVRRSRLHPRHSRNQELRTQTTVCTTDCTTNVPTVAIPLAEILVFKEGFLDEQLSLHGPGWLCMEPFTCPLCTVIARAPACTASSGSEIQKRGPSASKTAGSPGTVQGARPACSDAAPGVTC